MKRTLGLAVFGALVAMLGGCPIYSGGPDDYRVCDGNQCYDCPDNSRSSACVPWQCSTSIDCPGGYICGGDGVCVSPGNSYDGGVYDGGPGCTQSTDCPEGYTCGAGNTCGLGDCTTLGCPTGFECVLENGLPVCAEDVSEVDSGVPTPDGAVDGAVGLGDANTSPVDSGVACQTDSECAADGGTGARCLDGTCVPAANQCYDGTQCPTGDKCVQGACTPTCSASQACPTGYSCDTNGVCTGDPTPCEANPSLCTGGTVCSQNHCVAPCGTGVVCATGDVCVQGGCVPNQLPQFTCSTDGVQDACASGSVCLHHSCYIGCAIDAANACQSADQFNQCKAVTTSSGTYDVCGSSTNLGSQCSPTLACASAGVCIDGYCH